MGTPAEWSAVSAEGASEVDALFAVGAADATHGDGLWDLVCRPVRAVAGPAGSAGPASASDSAASLVLSTPRSAPTPRSAASGAETPRSPSAGNAHTALLQRRSKLRALQQVPAALSQSTARLQSLWEGPLTAVVGGGGGGTRAWRVARAHARSAALMLLRGVMPTARPPSEGTGPGQGEDFGKMLWPRGSRICPAAGAGECVACAVPSMPPPPPARHA